MTVRPRKSTGLLRVLRVDPRLEWRVLARAANSRGSRGSHRTPSHPVEDPLNPLQIGKAPQEMRLH
jgi:hypothetical protein